MIEKDIIDAYCKIRTIDNTIPDDVLDFMKAAAIEKLKQITQSPYSDLNGWIPFDYKVYNPYTRPPRYDKYFVCRKDGKVHWETWNGTGWAYNGEVITHYMDIRKPIK